MGGAGGGEVCRVAGPWLDRVAARQGGEGVAGEANVFDDDVGDFTLVGLLRGKEVEVGAVLRDAVGVIAVRNGILEDANVPTVNLIRGLVALPEAVKWRSGGRTKSP